MVKAGETSDSFTYRSSVGSEDVEQVCNMKRDASTIETPLEKTEVMASNDGHDEDIDQWVGNLERILNDIPPYMCNKGHPGRISRIPENLREVDVTGYEPYFLSVGPYHHGKPRLQPMEMKKKLVFKCVLAYKPELTIKHYLEEIMSIEPIARSFYLDIQMDSEKFVQMLLLDSVYIVTAFCRLEKSQERTNEINARMNIRVANEDANLGGSRLTEEKGTGDANGTVKMMVKANESNDAVSIIGENWYWAMFAHDIFLIENQLPFLVLQKIHDLVYGGSGKRFIDIMKYEISYMLTYYIKQDPATVILRTEEVHHLLHLCHMFFRPTFQQDFTGCLGESSQMFRLGSVVQLYEAGVHFEVISGSTNYSLLDIRFDSSGRMAIPCLIVDDNTESLLRNLIALEQMKYPSMGLNISAYIVLLLHLITTPKDVELLRRKGIIEHHLASDKEMMYLINRLSIGLAFDYVEDEYSLKHVFHELKHYSERRMPRWKAWIKHRHFTNPWTTISLLAASFLLLLTLVQTYYAVYSYYYPYYNGLS